MAEQVGFQGLESGRRICDQLDLILVKFDSYDATGETDSELRNTIKLQHFSLDVKRALDAFSNQGLPNQCEHLEWCMCSLCLKTACFTSLQRALAGMFAPVFTF